MEGGLRTRGEGKRIDLKRPLISVITPVYNAISSIERCIRSVLEQPYDNVEHILVDGGSTDGTLDIISQYETKLDYWVSGPDAGIYDAMNKGINLARGDWLYFLGADDILVRCLHKVTPYLKHVSFIYYGDVYMPVKNKVYGGAFTTDRLRVQNICHQSIFYPRRVFQDNLYSLKYQVLADYEFNMRAWGDRRFHFRYIPVLVAIHADNGLSFQTIDFEFEHDRLALISKYLSRWNVGEEMRLQVRATLVGGLIKLGLKEPLSRLINAFGRFW
jgi:glycosyltransferase involved in cell wall biosynthesis